jgi:hypothetical protein
MSDISVRIVPFHTRLVRLPDATHSQRWALHLVSAGASPLVEQAWSTSDETGSYAGSRFCELDTFLRDETDPTVLDKLQVVLSNQGDPRATREGRSSRQSGGAPGREPGR